MCAKRLQELEVFQLADELRNEVHAITSRSAAREDVRFCSQIRDAVSSITRNIAEGFGRYRHKEFANFATIARGSAFEVADHLRDGVARKHWSADEVRPHQELCDRTIGALTRLIRYLKTHPDP